MSANEPMRVLFTSIAHTTHYYSMVPLAWALRCAGHEVRVASQPALADDVTRSGLTFVPVGDDHGWEELLFKIASVEPARDAQRIDFRDLLDDPDPEALLGFYIMLVPTLFGTVNNDSMVDDLVEFATDWKPDLVCWEPLTWAGAVAAKVTGAVHGRLLWNSDVLGATRRYFLDAWEKLPEELRDDPMREWLTWTLRRFGQEFDETVVEGQWVVDQQPPSLRLPTKQLSLPMSYVPYNGPSVVPEWVREKPERPRVCVTIGMSARSGNGFSSIELPELVEALASLDVELIVTVKADQRAEFGPLPDSVRLVDRVPLHALLPTCSAIVHHGGAGTECTALRSGVPQVVLPEIWDTTWKAALLEENGVALTEPANALDPASVRRKLERVLTEPSFRKRAAELRHEVLTQPSPAEVAAELERLVRTP